MDDAQLIEQLGGPTKVAVLLNFPKQGGAQRVQNWLSRGIPAHVKVKHPELFMPGKPNHSELAAQVSPGSAVALANGQSA